MNKTRDDLVQQALGVLGVLVTGQPPEVEDYDKVDGTIDVLVAQLAEEEVVYIGNVASIPSSLFLPLADVLADACKDTFGLGAEDSDRLQAGRTLAEAKLRTITRGRPTGEPIEVEYF